ncbi:MAG: DNA-binding protein [Glaciihabitans sp.]|nr:DNA-binding protein [Glaciihabitans sp.]
MQDLRVIGVENGALLVASVEGTRFRIPIDEVLQSKLRQSVPEPGAGRKLAPREIQAHIRSGMSAQDVSSITGVPLEYIQKFEGPVLAEREFVVTSALAVRVHTAADSDPLAQGSNFGSVIRERLYDLGAINERWASWKEAGSGWVVKLAFTADQIDHDARWAFDPKKSALSPINNEAVTLSQQGEAAGALIPRLRAVGSDEGDANSSRFDSGAFDLGDGNADNHSDTASHSRVSNHPTQDIPHDNNQTADLLEALRRRRGEREAANFADDGGSPSTAGQPSKLPGQNNNGIRMIDIPLDPPVASDTDDDDGRSTAPQPFLPQQQPTKARKGRQPMPTWDEIVFGARSDDDLA